MQLFRILALVFVAPVTVAASEPVQLGLLRVLRHN
jgi:hypothetical protein